MSKLRQADFAKIMRQGPVVKMGSAIGPESREALEAKLKDASFDKRWAAKCRKAGSLLNCKVKGSEVTFENDTPLSVANSDIDATDVDGGRLIAIHERLDATSAWHHYIVVPNKIPEEETPVEKTETEEK